MPKKTASKKRGRKSAKRGRPGRPKAARAAGRGRPPKAASPARATRRKRTRYSDAERTQILSAAQQEGLTALEIQKRFGVTPVTYYSWRKKSGAARTGRRGRPPGSSRKSVVMAIGSDRNLAEVVRRHVREQIQRMLPEIVRDEVGSVFAFEKRGSRARSR